jgi:heme a synthase
VRKAQRFRQFSAAVLAVTLGVILWGAYVRASGSGAGCGSHWPMCNGQIVPRAESIKTVIEFTHRATSGIAFLMVVVQTVWAIRIFPRGHGARRAAGATLFFMITEALVGAGLVIFEMVADNRSTARAGWMAAHLMNTFALLAAMGLVWWHAGPNRENPEMARLPAPGLRSFARLLWVGLAVVLIIAVSGAVAALGDTLFPAGSLSEGIAQDLSPTAHLFVRLRILHPVFAVVGAIYLLVVLRLLSARPDRGPLGPLSAAATGLVIAQVGAGLINLLLLAPIPLQILHLLLADLLWLTLVVLTASGLTR